MYRYPPMDEYEKSNRSTSKQLMNSIIQSQQRKFASQRQCQRKVTATEPEEVRCYKGLIVILTCALVEARLAIDDQALGREQAMRGEGLAEENYIEGRVVSVVSNVPKPK